MFSMPMKKVAERIRAVSRRTHNMPEDMRRAEIQSELDANWDRLMGKAETYLQGAHILEQGGHFSCLSMGNWHTLCEAAGIEITPGRVVAVINPVEAFDAQMIGVNERNMGFLHAITNGIQDIAEDEILRFDACVSGEMKAEIGAGRVSGGVVETKGWRRREDGVVFPEMPDQRIVQQMMDDPQNAAPVWVRKWVEPVMLPGSADAGYAAARQAHEAELEEGQTLASDAGDLFPCEWRVFVRNGAVVAVGNYYPQIARGTTPEDEAVALAMVAEAKRAAETLVARLAEAGAIPHHPRYEDRDGFDPDGVHFSLDFLEVEDADAPHGRRLVMIEGGPAHLRNPNWGAHPVSFGVAEEPSGIALSTADIRPRADLDAL